MLGMDFNILCKKGCYVNFFIYFSRITRLDLIGFKIEPDRIVGKPTKTSLSYNVILYNKYFLRIKQIE